MKQVHWPSRALTHARLITSASAGRGSATRAEARAADYVCHQLTEVPIGHVQLQPFTGSRSLWFFVSLAFGLALMGHLAYGLFQPALGAWAAWGVALLFFGFSFYLLWRKFTFRSHPLAEYLPRGPSQNVVFTLPANAEPGQKVVLLAHLDSHRAVIWFANDFLVSLYAVLSPLVIYGTLLAPIFYGLSILTGLQVFAWLGIAIGFLQFIAWFSGVTADLGVYSPGANDNASAVGSVLALAERLQQEPLDNTLVYCVFTGCEETGGDGLLRFLDEYGTELKDALFINFELVGMGDQLIYLQQEGILRRRKIDPQTEELINTVESPEIQGENWGRFAAYTEMGILWEHGYRGACLMVQDKKSRAFPHWHRITDTPDRLSLQAFQVTHAFAWELLQKYDRQTG